MLLTRDRSRPAPQAGRVDGRPIRNTFGDAGEARPGDPAAASHRRSRLDDPPPGHPLQSAVRLERRVRGADRRHLWGLRHHCPGPKDLWVAEQNGGIIGSIFVAPQRRPCRLGPAPHALCRAVGARAGDRYRAGGAGRGLRPAPTGMPGCGSGPIRSRSRRARFTPLPGLQVVETIAEDNFGLKMTGEIWEMVF